MLKCVQARRLHRILLLFHGVQGAELWVKQMMEGLRQEADQVNKYGGGDMCFVKEDVKGRRRKSHSQRLNFSALSTLAATPGLEIAGLCWS